MGLVAGFLAWPVAYYVMSLWLLDFSYRIQITTDVFIYSTLLALSIVVFHCRRTDPSGGQAESRRRHS